MMFGQLPPIQTTTASPIDYEYDYEAEPTPTTASAAGLQQNDAYGQPPAQFPSSSADGAEEALMDLAQLEEVHEEAEQMKLLGNKHMANREYNEAFDAYSAALQLSPVGPNSHVFLSNRSASLLSLKKYEAAATDARRAIALAPTFGKAHARLGQAMYFLKRYGDAVTAYQDAVEFEPENQVTRTYLEKAMAKLNRDSKSRASSDWESVAWQDSVATDPNRQHTLVTQPYNRGSSTTAAAMMAATTKNAQDPEFDEAVRIQKRANSFLVQKKYKDAIAEYTAALFLVPYDPVLSPDLHLGRAHALNGSRRHESARKDATMAIKLSPTPAAYSTLAKSQFYLKDYHGAIDSFRACEELLPDGESLGTFDLVYLEKADRAISHGSVTTTSERTPKLIPKLPPPRFVPREQAIAAPTTLPSLPKSWPQQLPTLQCGPERSVLFLSESLGVKLNRGSDGIVRVLTVEHVHALRQGEIHPGDVVREAAGVDLRRPITNVMWGDTVALIKMAARPIALCVAQELSPTPRSVLDEQKKALAPSRANGEEGVTDDDDEDDDIMEVLDTVTDDIIEVSELVAEEVDAPISAAMETVQEEDADTGEEGDDQAEAEDDADSPSIVPEEAKEGVLDGPGEDAVMDSNDDANDAGAAPQEPTVCQEEPMTSPTESSAQPNNEPLVCEEEPVEDTNSSSMKPTTTETISSPVAGQNMDDDDDSIESVDEPPSVPAKKVVAPTLEPAVADAPLVSLRTEEDKMIGGDILFLRNSPPAYQGWDTLRWMAHNGARKVNSRQTVYRYRKTERRGIPLFWKQGNHYEERALIVYDEPNIILVVRRPLHLEEIQSLLGLDDEPSTDEWLINPETAMSSYWILESVVDPSSSKLKLSSLTTSTSVPNDGAGDREKSCFHLVTPVETISLSTVDVRKDARREERSFTDSGAFLETLSLEAVIAQTICEAHRRTGNVVHAKSDITWKHQVIIGSLHSLVISGNPSSLVKGLEYARSSTADSQGRIPSRVLDVLDDNGCTPLYYACTMKMSGAVKVLVNAGADINVDTEASSLAHICAKNLDDQSLSSIFAAPARPNANKLDVKGRTPLYVAMVEGSVLDRGKDPSSLGRCIAVLKAGGGEIMPRTGTASLRHPVCALSYMWLPDYLAVLLKYCPFRYPLMKDYALVESSVAALYQFPIHCALLALRKLIHKSADTEFPHQQSAMLLQTLSILLDHGFEPNERLDTRAFGSGRTSLDELMGFAPLQVLALVALELSSQEKGVGSRKELSNFLADVAEFLVQNGAHLSMDPPMLQRLRHDKQVSEVKPRQVEILTTKIDSDNQVMGLLGGADRLLKAKATWSETKKIANTSTKCLDDEKNVVESSVYAGGSDSLSCCICWCAFGTLMNRKHRCRVMNRYVCDDCSSKRLVQVSNEIRVSDGQFLLARADESREQVQEQQLKTDQRSKQEAERKHAAVRSDRLKTEAQANRDSLFGGLVGSASQLVFGGQDQQQDQINGLTASLGQTRDALNQRGEKLNSLGEKSAQLVDTSSDFAKMAKELRKQSEGGLFW